MIFNWLLNLFGCHHKWGKWNKFLHEIDYYDGLVLTSSVNERRQYRVCEKCGLRQERKL